MTPPQFDAKRFAMSLRWQADLIEGNNMNAESVIRMMRAMVNELERLNNEAKRDTDAD